MWLTVFNYDVSWVSPGCCPVYSLLFSLCQKTNSSIAFCSVKPVLWEKLKSMQGGDEDQICSGKRVLPQVLKKGIQIAGTVSLFSLLFLYPWTSIPRHKLIQCPTLLSFEEFLLFHILNIERVQLIKESFSGSIYVPGKNIFRSFTAFSWMSFQNRCSVKESVKLSAEKELEDCISVAHVTLSNIVCRQSNSTLVFLRTPSIEFTHNFSLYNIKIVEKNFEFYQLLNWNIVIVGSLELIRSETIPSILSKMLNFEVSSSNRWFPCKWRAKARKRQKLFLYGCFVLRSYLKQLFVWFLCRNSHKTASLQPIGSSLSKEKNTIRFISL